ncbi:MAG: bifunctional folylpolyglutamate synthase/dihydrofolate synthase [Candidatus Binatia bacterium]
MTSYSETLDRIYNLRGGMIDLRLDRMDRALALFDHPEKKYFSFHIAGTNGKGSTAAMLHRILSHAGYHAALYTSPHLVSFTERIRAGDDEISPDEVVALADEITERTAAAATPLTFFEFVTVMAFVYFARRQVDVCVVEVGLGGRLDATNLVRPAVSVITTISQDHEAYLGSDLGSIAREKGGIIKQNVPVVCGDLPNEALEAIQGIARSKKAPLYSLKQNFSFLLKSGGCFDYKGLNWQFEDLSVALRGRHQRGNAAVALCALELVARDFPVSEDAVREGLRTVVWPGRFEVLGTKPTVVLDGAHNGEGVRALIEEIRDFRGGRKVKMLFAAMDDKDWRSMLDGLSEVVDEMVLTRVAMSRSADPHRLAARLSDKIPHRAIESSPIALRSLLDTVDPDDIVLVAGSLYLLGEIRPLVQESGNRLGFTPSSP